MERERLFDIAAPYVERLAGDAEDKVEAEIVEVRGEDTQSAATRGSVVAAPHGFEERVGKGLDAEAEPIDAGVAPFAAAGVGDIVGVGLKGDFRAGSDGTGACRRAGAIPRSERRHSG